MEGRYVSWANYGMLSSYMPKQYSKEKLIIRSDPGYYCNFLNFQSMRIPSTKSKTFKFLRIFCSNTLLKYCILKKDI